MKNHRNLTTLKVVATDVKKVFATGPLTTFLNPRRKLGLVLLIGRCLNKQTVYMSLMWDTSIALNKV